MPPPGIYNVGPRGRRGPDRESSSVESGFGPVGRTPLVFLSFYLDLPLDAGISQGAGFINIQFEEPALADWAGFDLQRFLCDSPLAEPAVRPCTALYFHRVTNDVPQPFANVLKAEGLQFHGSFAALENLPAFPESRSVVNAIRIVPHTSAEFGGEWLREQFAVVLSTLNAKLLALGAAAEDHTLGPISEQQLPSLLVGFHGDMRNVQGGEIRKLVPFRLALHRGSRAGGKDHDDGIIKRAIAIADNAGQGPFFPALEFFYAARRSFDMGLYRQAVMDTGTAIELLVERVLFGIELEKGSSQERMDNLLEKTGFQNLVRDHLAKRLGVTLDKPYSGPDPLSNWLRVAYKLRNRVAHDGYTPTVLEAMQAVELTDELIHFVAMVAEQNAEFGIALPGFDEPSPSEERSSAQHEVLPTVLAARGAFQRGVAALEAGETGAAKLAFAEADEKGSPSGAYNYAALCFADSDEAAGMAALRRATERGHPLAPAQLGVKLLKNGEETEAEEFLLRAPTHHPKAGALASFYLGVIASGRGELERAAEQYKQTAVFDESTLAGEAAFRRGIVLEELGDLPTAVNAHIRGAELGSARALAKLTELLREPADLEAAVAAYERAHAQRHGEESTSLDSVLVIEDH
jgi:tetratricopeptide (TPR) repeat protein